MRAVVGEDANHGQKSSLICDHTLFKEAKRKIANRKTIDFMSVYLMTSIIPLQFL